MMQRSKKEEKKPPPPTYFHDRHPSPMPRNPQWAIILLINQRQRSYNSKMHKFIRSLFNTNNLSCFVQARSPASSKISNHSAKYSSQLLFYKNTHVLTDEIRILILVLTYWNCFIVFFLKIFWSCLKFMA